MEFIDKEKPSCFETYLVENEEPLCECRVAFERDVWSISSWYTNKQYLHKGLGFKTLQHNLQELLSKKGEPEEIRYIWNGANEYVMDWLKQHFTPVSMLPVSMQKENDIDSWDAHVYVLDKDKVFEYFRLDRSGPALS